MSSLKPRQHSLKKQQKVNPVLANYAEMILGLHKTWKAHQGQVKVFKPIISGKTKDLFVQAGRNWGKTEGIAYCLWRWARTYPNSENYYFAPYMKQAREILWASKRMQSFGPQHWIKAINETEMRITFTNGSFIKLDGSDNVEAYRGVKPKGLSVLDEFKDFKPDFYVAYDPNRAAHDSPIIIIGTPPDRECQFTEVADEFKINPKKCYFEAPSHDNPHLPAQFLIDKELEYKRKGEEDVWQREYLAKYVKGGRAKIFPMLNKSIVRPFKEIKEMLYRDRRKLQWYLIADPAAASVFGALFCALNPYNKTWYFLDEIYETDQALMSTTLIGKVMREKKAALWDGEWTQVYDEAEAWFRTEIWDKYQEHFIPTNKALNDKDNGLSLIKDVMLQHKVIISDQCVKLYWELDNYFKDKKGNIPKEKDHLIDCFRYALGAAQYSLNKEVDPDTLVSPTAMRKISDDFPELDNFGEQTDDFDMGVSDLWR